ncbi:tail fiber domain-containing protein [Sphingobacterium alkalisoli]|uniref:Tail fiber domain-containing protein n=1 Tax=Sphingobacterium alkalisoli TaxID=1874115 RepID=A0A4U0H437_9SPHI|nr:tail fiber domain-containing protein [Sphingobacterium alkalisoli]TJY66420.1 tail fiber domain-containing protein [Sphingobacterium alkalisoli]GGH16512.1 peptidase S74 [Sphingobacterium alkalisoli]
MKPFLLPLLALAVGSANVAQSQIKIVTNGSIGMGTENPVHPLHINMSRFQLNYSSNAPLYVTVASSDPRICSNSKIVFYNTAQTGHIPIQASAFNTMSDERLKTNIQKLSSNDGHLTARKSPLEVVLSLNGYIYDLKQDINSSERNGQPVKHQIGFLAQELEKEIPEVVQTNNDSTELKSVSYGQIVPYLVEAIKEQQAIIEELKSRLQQVEGKSAARKEDASLQRNIAALEPKK